MKKIASYVFMAVVACLSFVFVSTVHAVGPTLTIGSQEALNSASITVPITGSNLTVDTDVVGVQFRVNYDNTLLSYTGYTGAATGVTTVNNTGSYINVLWDHSSALILNDETFISLNFNVISGSDTVANLTHSNESVSNSLGDPIVIQFIDGAISLNHIVSSDATVTSGTYTVSSGGTASETITNIPFGTEKSIFLAGLVMAAGATWNDSNIADPVVTGNTLVVTAEDGTTTVTYTVTTSADLTAYNNALSAVQEADYTIATWTVYQAIVDANVVTDQNSQAEVDAATANIIAAQADLIEIADLTAYNNALSAVQEADYTIATWTVYQAIVDANVVTDQNSQAEVDAATANIIAAQADLIEIADLTAYNNALSAVQEADYTIATWTVYQAIVDANVVTDQNSQAEVDAATANIIAAQADLIEIADLTAYNNALSAVQEADYTIATWTVYQAIVDANVVTDQNSQAEVDAATANIIAAQADLIEIADLTAYNNALSAVQEADYTIATWTVYQAIVDANVVTDQNSQAEVDAATANIIAAQADLIELMAAPTADPEGDDYAYSLLVGVNIPNGAVVAYYTNDGSEPSNLNGTLVTGPIGVVLSDINDSVTLKVIAYDSDGNESAVMTEIYTYDIDAPADAGDAMEGAFVDGDISVEGDNPSDTPSVTFEEDFTLEDGDATVFFPAGMEMTKTGGGNINILEMTMEDITDSLNGALVDDVAGAIKIGLPSIRLTFDPAITVTIPVGEAYNGQTLNIYYQFDGETTWNMETTCLISNGVCSFETTHATKFASGLKTPSATGSDNGDNDNDEDSCGKRCKLYKEYKRKYKNASNKTIYKQVKILKKTNAAEFERLKDLYAQYRTAGKRAIAKLDIKTQNDFKLYKKYRGYKLYLFYKK